MAVAKKRHLAKAFTWRIIATTITTVTTWFVTGSVTAGLSIGLIDAAIKFGVYYYHERLWYKFRWGIQSDVPKNKGKL